MGYAPLSTFWRTSRPGISLPLSWTVILNRPPVSRPTSSAKTMAPPWIVSRLAGQLVGIFHSISGRSPSSLELAALSSALPFFTASPVHPASPRPVAPAANCRNLRRSIGSPLVHAPVGLCEHSCYIVRTKGQGESGSGLHEREAPRVLRGSGVGEHRRERALALGGRRPRPR